MSSLSFFQSFLEPWLQFLADEPMLRMLQGAMLLGGIVVVFLIFFTTRDILLRTHSFVTMLLSIVLVAVFPVVGFLLYLLIRPPQTLKERDMERMLKALLAKKKEVQKAKADSGDS